MFGSSRIQLSLSLGQRAQESEEKESNRGEEAA
jgi:hypothetical protein